MSNSIPIALHQKESHSSDSVDSRESDHRISDTSSILNVTAEQSDSFSNSPIVISQSCPENGHFKSMHRIRSLTRQPLQVPRAPSLGFVASPSIHEVSPMPELFLPPPARPHSPAESVLQFPSSCPVNFHYMRQQTASLLRKNQSNYRASPSLAAMSAFQRSHENECRDPEESHENVFSLMRLDEDTKLGFDGVNGAIFDFEEQ